MSRRRRLAWMAAIACCLALAACGSAHAGTSTAHKTVVAAPSDNGDTSPEPDPSPTSAPPVTGPPVPSRPAGPAVPHPSPSATGAPSSSAPAHPWAGHGPFGSMVSTGTPAVALTFDDGPSAYTDQVLDLLAQYHIKATFCLIGRQVAAYAQQVRRIVAEGHTLCDHTWTHDLNLGRRSPDQIRSEMQKTIDAIHAIVPDVPVKYFRAPGGNWTAQIVSIAGSLGMSSIHWSVDPQDWRRPPPGAISGNVLGHTGQGGIVLMHDGGGDRSYTVTALRTILPNLAGRFTLIPLPTS
jgi:peptidoglycan/xylan/chitin deacetylase (PgdA/CDA1 family)